RHTRSKRDWSSDVCSSDLCADRAPPARGGLRVVGDGVGDQQHAQSGAAHTPTEIDVVAKQRQGGVEATEAVPHVTPNEHARAGDREDMPVPVVLAVVELTLFQTGLAASRSVDGHTDLDEQ